MGKDKMSRAHEVFAQQLLQDFRDKITGAKVERLCGAIPEDAYYVGMLSPVRDDEADPGQAFSSQVFISNMGLDFDLPTAKLQQIQLRIYPQGDFYYRCLPTYEEQCEAMLEAARRDGIERAGSMEALRQDERGRKLEIPVRLVFKKVSLHEGGAAGGPFSLTLPLGEYLASPDDGLDFRGDGPLADAIEQQMQVLNQQITEDPERYRSAIYAKVTMKDLRDAAAFHNFLERSAKRDVVIGNNWSYEVRVRGSRHGDRYHIALSLLNTSQPRIASIGTNKRDAVSSETLFNGGLRVRVDGAELQPTLMDFFRDDYKYDRQQYAMGVNCAVEVDADHCGAQTNNLPAFTQHRLISCHYDKVDLHFQAYIDKPLENLRRILKYMQSTLARWRLRRQNQDANLTPKGKEQFDEEISGFESEIQRFKQGIDLLASDSGVVGRAFQLMNETVKRSSRGNYDAWRLFQIVFIVSNLPAITACDENLMTKDERKKSHLRDMSLLYFPTGGGKTEAFLGVLLYNLFFDRIRGKSAGVTSILRYPLRLLSVQQVQRLANMLAQAELLRRQDPELADTDPFSLGYFVGGQNTKNNITDEEFQELQAMAQETRDKQRIIEVCPFCHEHTVHLQVDYARRRLLHRCDNPQCPSGAGGELPLYITDQEIYRYLPSAIISTVDKMAIMGNNRNFRSLLSGATARCPKHGYTVKGHCLIDGCEEELEPVELYDPAPSLLIQDELHLINESLGAYASHYESFLHFYIEHLSPSQRPVKVIGATATISSYQNQVAELYRKTAIRFPAASPYLDENFYARIDKEDTQRQLIGYAPYGKALVNSVVYSLKYMRECVDRYLHRPKDMLAIPGIGITTGEEARKVLEDYWIFLEYNNAKRDSNTVDNALESPINPEMLNEDLSPFVVEKMTGDSNFQEVRRILAEVEGEKDVFRKDFVNLITATSMISHGVDADRFNIMFFFGIPSKMAEYIQAYSRTGRRYSSLVIDIMRPSRESDMSYLKNFGKMHEYKDIFVDNVAINRWASKAIQHTLPGLFMAFILNHYLTENDVGNVYQMQTLQRLLASGRVPREEMQEYIYQAYGCKNGNIPLAYGSQYEKRIDAFLEDIYQQIDQRQWSQESIFDGFKELGYPIMNNLRSTEDQVTIELE